MSWQYKLASSVRASPKAFVTRPDARLLLRPTARGAAGGFSAGSGTWDDLRLIYRWGLVLFPLQPLLKRGFRCYRITPSHCFFPWIASPGSYLPRRHKPALDLPCLDLNLDYYSYTSLTLHQPTLISLLYN